MHIQGETKQTDSLVLAYYNVTKAMQKVEEQRRAFLWSSMNHDLTSHTGHQRSETAMEDNGMYFTKAKEDNGMINIKDVLSPGERVLFWNTTAQIGTR